MRRLNMAISEMPFLIILRMIILTQISFLPKVLIASANKASTI